MTALIIDDEEIVRTGLSQLCKLFLPDVEVLDTVGNLEDAVTMIRDHSPDLIFLDIQLGNDNGFGVLTAFPEPSFQTIFVTAHDEYALKALKKQAIDYILKPVDPEDLIKAVEKASSKSLKQQVPIEKLVIKELENIHAIPICEIPYLAANGSYTTIYTTEKEYISSKNIKYYEELLKSHQFLRVHKSFLVNMKAFKQFDKTMNLIILTDGSKIQVSARKREELYAFLRKEAF